MSTEVKICKECGCVIEDDELYLELNGNYYCKDCVADGNVSGYVVCDDCGKIIAESNSTLVHSDSDLLTVCGDCRKESYAKCYDCGEYYPKDDMRLDIYDNRICPDCRDDHYSTCEDCGRLIDYNSDDEYEVHHSRYGDYIVCVSCIDEYYKCDHCGKYFDRDNVRMDDSDHCVCESCYGDYYYTCYNCGDIIHADYTSWGEDDDNPYCEHCFDEYEGRNSIHNYSYKPSPLFFSSKKPKDQNNKLFMGVELEIDNGDDANAVAKRITKAMDFDCEQHVYCKHDGSLNDGVEIVSHPCTLSYHMGTMPWDDIMGIAVDEGFLSHNANTCGLHVHVSRKFFGDDTTEQDLAIAKLIMIIDKFWDKVVVFSRRRISELDHWACKNDIGIVSGDLMEDINKKMDSQKNNGRYHAINLCNSSTIEFRIFRGTLKYNTFIATLQFVETLCIYAKNISLNNIYNISWYDIFANTEYEELREYMTEKNLLTNNN